jgi:hypothetical protein
MMPQWKTQALALIAGVGVANEDAIWALECIEGFTDDLSGEPWEKYEMLSNWYKVNRDGDLHGIDAETFAGVLACLGIDMHRLEMAFIERNDWSME